MTAATAPRTIIQNVRWLAGANIIVKPLWFVFLLLSTRFLGPSEFGKFMYAVSYVSVLAAFLEGGVDILAMRTLARDPARFEKFFAHSTFVKLVAGLVLALVTIVSVWLSAIPPQASYLLMCGVVYCVLNALMVHARFVFRAFEVMQYEGRSLIVEKLAIVLLCGAALFVGRDAATFMLAYVLAYAVSAGSTLVMIARRFGLPRWNIDLKYVMREIIVPAAPFALMNMFMVVYFRSGTLMLQWLTGNDQFVGYYNAGYRLVESFALFPSIIVLPLYASFSRGSGDPAALRPMLLQGTRLIGFLSVMIAVPMCLLRDDVTRLFFGAEFSPAAGPVGVIVLAMIPVGMTWLFGSLAGAVGRQARLNYYILGITILNVLFNYLVIPRFGVKGAAAVTLGTESAMAAASLWVVRDYLDAGRILRLGARIIVPAVTLGLLIGMLSAPFPLRAGLLLAGLTGAYVSLGVVTIGDLKRLFARS